MKSKNENSNLSRSTQPTYNSEGSGNLTRLPSDYSQPTLKVEGFEQNQMIFSSDVNLTIRLKVKEFTRRQATILAGQALYLVAQEGLSLNDWMVLEFLYSYLIGSKLEVWQIRDSKEFELSLLLKVAMMSVQWLDLREKVEIPQDVRLFILNSKWVPNKRTYSSRRNLFSLNKFLSVRIVSIDNLLDRSNDSQRYSSYCKGYGESSLTGRRKKTRPSAELDGEPVVLENDKLINFSLQRIQQIQDLLLLEIKYRRQH